MGEFTLSDSHKRSALAITLLFFYAVCGILERLVWTVIYCVLLCGLHLVFRPRSVTSKSNKVYEELKLSGFGGIFTRPSGTSSSGSGSSGHSSGSRHREEDPENPRAQEDEGVRSGAYSSSYAATDADMRKRGAPTSKKD
ncbi:hypothetical protein B484DRAFT_402022 [Ochromonadaceae sp. CCMP2298]|nr:hypothetical protein B484DRAFT_402022 [Ochromonadaceae sp. CCMP2298]